MYFYKLFFIGDTKILFSTQTPQGPSINHVRLERGDRGE